MRQVLAIVAGRNLGAQIFESAPPIPGYAIVDVVQKCRCHGDLPPGKALIRRNMVERSARKNAFPYRQRIAAWSHWRVEIAAVSLDPSSASKPATDLQRLINLLSRLQHSRHTAVAPAN